MEYGCIFRGWDMRFWGRSDVMGEVGVSRYVYVVGYFGCD